MSAQKFSARARALIFFSALLVAASSSSLAQTPATMAPAISADGLSITPQNGQNPQQQMTDRSACENWSKSQTGFDVTQPTGGVSSGEFALRRQQFNRAMTACLEARGYAVRVATPAPVPPTYVPPPRYVVPVPRYVVPVPPPIYAHYSPPVLKYHPFSVHVDGGFSITTGNTSQNLDDGTLGGLGFSFFPSKSLPLGLRVDGSYTWFRARDQFLIANSASFGHEDVYGGDADLQFNLGTHASRAQMYLFGGAGWYREQTVLHQVSVENGTVCGFYFCGPGQFPAISGTERSTTPWRDSWNAGLGWEAAITDSATFFIEARYRRILPNASKQEFVPIDIGFRF